MRAAITPWLLTLAPSSATEPPPWVLMLPWLSTVAPLVPVNLACPAKKSLSPRLSVEATKPPTFTLACGPNKMPLGLSKNTWPLDDRRPKMLEASAPSTRLSSTAWLLGCTNCTPSPAPMLKLCQLMTALGVVWVMVLCWALLLILAAPAATTPPWGKAAACGPKPMAKASASALSAPPAAVLVQEEVFLPPLWAFSATATKVPVVSFQRER